MKESKYFLKRPEQIKISLTNVCNYRCIMCPNSSFKQPRGFMEDSLAFKVIDECAAEGIHRLSLGSTGEPLLHKGFVKYLKYAKERGLWVSTTTNCALLTPEITEAMLSLGIDRVILSLYSASPEEHKKYCLATNFETVVKNVTYFLEQWSAAGRPVEVVMPFLSIPGVNDIHSHMAFWRPLTERCGVNITLKEESNWAGSVNYYKNIKNRWGYQLVRNHGRIGLRSSRTIPCPHLRYYCFILQDGTVHPCCIIMDSTDHPEFQFGNIIESSIMDVWNSRRYGAFKRQHFKKTVDGYATCSLCEERFSIKEWSIR